ncbi:hypothetical protein AMAG_06407 [Allomyces macrogynus ATCC 38327]|uniref:Uncharacterized protein n=1 Tax=Allomyces macrogynus (strain ATCC 38327) TaxID=578462 RepID=A0A0L0SGM0_ALLM3|nr:hypothetical protein AMAG_06407 [Allomyces macrogynus ATCC 38327]|eukprot:KNE61594.1 hypothetical protein AMAG_06407 [Allomyces macrogynus ATCC 38327]
MLPADHRARRAAHAGGSTSPSPTLVPLDLDDDLHLDAAGNPDPHHRASVDLSLLPKTAQRGHGSAAPVSSLRKLLRTATTSPNRRRALLSTVAALVVLLVLFAAMSAPSSSTPSATANDPAGLADATPSEAAVPPFAAPTGAVLADGDSDAADPAEVVVPLVDSNIEWFPPVAPVELDETDGDDDSESEPAPEEVDRAATAVASTDVFHHYRSRADPDVFFLDSDPTNIEPLGTERKLGLVVVPAGQTSKRRVNKLIHQFGLDNFAFLLCLWDNSTWTEFDWYPKVTTVRARGQAKFWFVKRFVPPEVALAYDYIWMLDDDMSIDLGWDPVDATEAMKKYNVHFAQSALTMGEHFDQGQIEKRVPLFAVGHWTNFIEMMAPIVSRGAYACAWTLIPWDTSSSWGVDNMLYPVCSSIGYCRFSILDAFPMKHLDTKTFVGSIDKKVREAKATGDLIDWFCAHVQSGLLGGGSWAAAVRSAFCARLQRRDVFHEYLSFGEMRPRHAARQDTCFEEPGEMGEMSSVPWWYPRMV